MAVSRARLGLYVVARKSLFDTCHELQPAMQIFDSKPNKLQLVSGEKFPTSRGVHDEVEEKDVYEVEDVTSLGLLVHSMQEQLCCL